jgi:hypothetical protein
VSVTSFLSSPGTVDSMTDPMGAVTSFSYAPIQATGAPRFRPPVSTEVKERW